MPDFEPIPYRIRIGVTGHRKLDDPAAMQATVKKAIDAEVEKLFPEASRQNIDVSACQERPQFRIRVLSPLAEGADRVVARAVLDYPGARLDVVLPLTSKTTSKTSRPKSRKQEFQDLLARCRRRSFCDAPHP